MDTTVMYATRTTLACDQLTLPTLAAVRERIKGSSVPTHRLGADVAADRSARARVATFGAVAAFVPSIDTGVCRSAAGDPPV